MGSRNTVLRTTLSTMLTQQSPDDLRRKIVLLEYGIQLQEYMTSEFTFGLNLNQTAIEGHASLFSFAGVWKLNHM
uniref:Uncharacterized protein n=1 Tax=Lutzomyia longipalpis TaxID=7200 RepID=A0A1B0CPX0_LUTLO